MNKAFFRIISLFFFAWTFFMQEKVYAFGECSEYGIWATYDYLSGGCECMSGYVFGKDLIGETQCISEDQACKNQYGFNTKSTFGGKCECENGYGFSKNFFGSTECVRLDSILKKYYVVKDISSDDKVIVEDSLGSQLLLEYGVGCVSMWLYEGKDIYIDVSGLLDGIGDRIYLLDSNQDCRIWDVSEVDRGSGIYNSYSVYLVDRLTAACKELRLGFDYEKYRQERLIEFVHSDYCKDNFSKYNM